MHGGGGLRGSVRPCSPTPDSSSQTIFCLDRLISSKGDYFSLSALSRVSLPFSTAAPQCSDFILPRRISGPAVIWTRQIPVFLWAALIIAAALPVGGGVGVSSGFQLDAWRLSAVCFCVISQREWIVCGTPVTPRSQVLSTVAGDSRAHNHILISVGRDRSLAQLTSFIRAHLSSQKLPSQSLALARCLLFFFLYF